ncbi:unnamed protein product [Choristocarpus tenellus]
MCKEGKLKTKSDGFILSSTALDMIEAYKYKSGSYTWLDNKLTPFWNWAVTLLPMWMAPNLVTSIGLIGIVFSTAIVTSFSPTLESEVPRWCYILFVIFFFIYQTLDAIDGKQARRTNSSSPLGQLFDHGCDTIVKLLCSIAIAASMRMGSSWKTMLVFCMIEGVFYFAQWEEYHTGTLNWSNGLFGVTESQYLQMFILLAAAAFGEDVWVTPIPAAGDLTIWSILIVIIPACAVLLVGDSVYRVWGSSLTTLPMEERGRKSVSPLRYWFPWAWEKIEMEGVVRGCAEWLPGEGGDRL